MIVAIAQINCLVGDLAGNQAKIIASAKEAQAKGATLLLTPELSLCGYPPEDLLLRSDFLQACDAALQALSLAVPDMTLVVGHPQALNGGCYNAASVLQGGKIVASYHKQALPNYSVFDEKRYFSPGHAPLVFIHQGVQLGLLICEDIWQAEPARLARAAGAELLLVINASPFDLEKQASRLSMLRERALELALPIVYLNSVGGQDELVFDGGSMVVAADGQVTQHLPSFETALATVTLDAGKLISQPLAPALSQEASVYQALTLGLADYVAKNRFPGVVLGLSGGVDSALTLAIAVDALGADSVDDAIDMAKRLGVRYSILPIGPLFEGFKATLAPEFAGLPFDTTEENLQARIRGMLLMALSNKFGSMVLTTGNKSEMAVGYCTLYGDMAGGFALLKDVFKTLVYRLCAYRNGLSSVIPERIITRPPSAELRADQTDQDSLPDYAVLDAIVAAYVEQDLGRADILAMGFAPADVTRVLKLIDSNEYKRRQSPVGVRISHKNFGKDRRYPITAKLDF
ncbi:MAG: hypothetical protein RLZZ434_1331 [Pseudomonadota bacterium]